MTRTYKVSVTAGAKGDLRSLHRNILRRRSRAEADALLDDLLDRAESLRTFPERGSVPPELEEVGLSGYRQIRFGRIRLVYLVRGDAVFILLVADVRRDLQSLLRDRLLRSG